MELNVLDDFWVSEKLKILVGKKILHRLRIAINTKSESYFHLTASSLYQVSLLLITETP
jgi:hypothetical protein